MFYLSKILPLFVLPLGIAFVLVLAGLVFKRRLLVAVAMVFLCVCSMPLTGRLAMSALETGRERLPAAEAPEAEAIVVLSGGRLIAPGAAGISEWTDANRFFGGVELFHAGRAPRLIFTGGWAPWQPDARPEGDILVEYAALCGVPPEALATTGKVLNTLEEAEAVKAMFDSESEGGDLPRILLVTSAFHMPRSVAVFERSGFQVEPFSVHFLISADRRFTILDLVPSSGGLEQTSFALREFYGRAFVAMFKRKGN